MRRYKLLTGLVALGLGAAVGLSACGGDDAPETPIVVTDQAPTLTKDEFITQADALCDDVNAQVAQIADAGEGITRAGEVANLRDSLATEIRGLGSPVDDGSSSSSTSTGVEGTTTEPDVSTFPGDSTDGTDTATDTTAAGSAATGSATSTGDDLEDFLVALAAQAAAGEKIDLANQRGEDTLPGENELNAAKDRASAAATSYGFEICGTDGTTSTDTSTPDTSTDADSATPSAPVPVTPIPPSSDSGGSDSSGSTDDGSGSGDSGGVGAGGGVGPG
jgi:hypothetical protein